MALFGKKKDNDYFDDWGEKTPPFSTMHESLDDIGVYQIRGKSKKVMTIYSILVYFIIFVITTVLLLSMTMGIRSGYKSMQLSKKIDSMESPAFKTRYSELGQAVIRAYYSSQLPPINLMNGVQWDRAGGVSQSSSGSGQAAPKINITNLALVNTPATIEVPASKEKGSLFTKPRSEVLVYTGYVNDKLYQFSVNLIIPNIDDPSVLPYLASPPVMMPVSGSVISTESGLDQPRTGGESPYSEVQINEYSMKTINDWANAYAQDNRDEIKKAVGDNDATHEYHGIGGFNLQGAVTPLWSYVYNSGTPDNKEDDAIVARIQFNIVQKVENDSNAAQKEVLGIKDTTFVQTQTMDILIDKISEGQGSVSAWLPAGSWSSLSSKMNAVTMNDPQHSMNSSQVESAPGMNDESAAPRLREKKLESDVPQLESQEKSTPITSTVSEETTSKTSHKNKTTTSRKTQEG